MRRISLIVLAAALVLSTFALIPLVGAQQPAPPPGWKQGQPDSMASSSLSPHAQPPAPMPGKDIPVDRIKVPAGFKVSLWADGISNARAMTWGEKGTLFVSSRVAGNVYAVVDRGASREVKVIAKGLNLPNGVAFKNGTLYIAEISRITKMDGIEDRLDNPPAMQVVYDKLPTDAPHGWKYMSFGPDGKLYFNIGAPCNICMPPDTHAAIVRVNPDGTGFEYYVRGVRNSVGHDFHPVTKELYFTNHGRDWMGDDAPNDTFHHAPRAGLHFGFPFCHQGDILDPEFGRGRSCSEFTPAAPQDGAPRGEQRRPLLSREHVPRRLSEPRVHRRARLLEPHRDERLPRGDGDAHAGPGAEARGVRRGLAAGRQVLGPAGVRPGDEGRLAPGLRRLRGGHLPHHLPALRRLGSLIGAAAVAAILGATAGGHAPAADVEPGRRKAEVCGACHGPDGNSLVPGTPSLAGQPALFTHWQLIKYRDGRRQDPQMSPAAANLSDADMADLAAYYAAQAPRRRPAVVDTAKADTGRRLATLHHCTSCHRPGLVGHEQVPRLAGQDFTYILKLLRAFKARTATDLDGMMTMSAQPLEEADIENLVHFIASLPAEP